jgi:hypothetical protein
VLLSDEDPVVSTLEQGEDGGQAGAAVHAPDDISEARELRRRR